MFCLRSWIPILFFLYDHTLLKHTLEDDTNPAHSKNASPVYLILFISATYFLNRPCVYCSLLLAILVFALFDFHAPWFEASPYSNYTSQNSSNILVDSLAQATSSLLPDYIVEGVASVVSKAAENGVVRAVTGGGVGGAEGVSAGLQGTFVEWAKGVLRKEWRIQCLDLIIRL